MTQLPKFTALKVTLAICILSVFTACGNNASTFEAASDVGSTSLAAKTLAETQLLKPMSADAYRPPASTLVQESPIKPRNLLNAPVPANITLRAPLASQSTAMQKSNESALAVATTSGDILFRPLKIGFGRPVEQTSTTAATQETLKWQTTPSGGKVTAINFESTGAKGIRLGLLVTQLPETATLRYYAKGAATAFEVIGTDVLKVLASNLASGDKSDSGRTYWAPSIEAANATLEIELPNGISTNAVNVAVPQVIHMTMSTNEVHELPGASAFASGTDGVNLGATCHVDVTCAIPSLPAASDALARLYFVFIEPDGAYAAVCSATLLNDSISSGTPYLLTANHCISTQTVASTIESKFQYRSKVCNIAANYTYFDTTPTGAKLLYTAYSSDSTLLQLNGKPASPTPMYVGWDATPAVGSDVTNIHHPMGGQQRMSKGKVSGYSIRLLDNPYATYAADITSGNIVTANLTYGVVQPGSSGSGLFSGTDVNPKLIGVLYAGSDATCSVPDPTKSNPQYALYGRFDVGYKAGMSDSLSPRAAVYRFYNTRNGTHFFSINVAEKNAVRAKLEQYYYEGPSFQAETMQKTSTLPVYRFYNARTQSHFYTISETEKTNIIAKLPQFALEGVSWYAKDVSQVVAGDGTIPLYRFYNLASGTHFYTNSLAERDSVIAKLSKLYYYEGIAYHVWP
jgi:lysyl endopeptidase